MSRIRANQITNQSADGAPTVQNGLIITGVCTATSFSGIDASALTDSGGTVRVQATTTGAVVTGIVTASGRVGVGTVTTSLRNALPGKKKGQ